MRGKKGILNPRMVYAKENFNPFEIRSVTVEFDSARLVTLLCSYCRFVRKFDSQVIFNPNNGLKRFSTLILFGSYSGRRFTTEYEPSERLGSWLVSEL